MSASPQTPGKLYREIEEKVDGDVSYELNPRSSELTVSLYDEETDLKAELAYQHENSNGREPGTADLTLKVYKNGDELKEANMKKNISRHNNLAVGEHADLRNDLGSVLMESVEFAEELISYPSSINYGEIVEDSSVIRNNEAYDLIDEQLAERTPSGLSSVNDLDTVFRTNNGNNSKELKEELSETEEAEEWRKMGERLADDQSEFDIEDYEEIKTEWDQGGFNTSIKDVKDTAEIQTFWPSSPPT